jgi:hypothetical protein
MSGDRWSLRDRALIEITGIGNSRYEAEVVDIENGKPVFKVIDDINWGRYRLKEGDFFVVKRILPLTSIN